jgi:hypothetical protein
MPKASRITQHVTPAAVSSHFWSPVLREGFVYFLLMLGTRATFIFAIGWLTHGSEFTSDIHFQEVYAADPFQLILGRPTTWAVFPPLFPLLLSAVYSPLSLVLPTFYAMRATMCCFELLAWPLVWWIIATNIQGTMRHLVALAVVFAPICWVSSSVMCQDEAISMGFFAAIIIALLRHRLGLAMFLCGVAVVVAKIYFLVPLVGLIGLAADRSWGTWLRQGLLGIAPIIAVYGLQALLTSRQDQGVKAFADFAPPAAISISVWVIIDQLVTLSAQHAKSVSGILALASSMLPLWLFRKRSFAAKPIDQARVLVAMMLWVFGVFYLINPEYYLLVVPGIILVLRPIATIWTIFVLFSFPWAVNFFYGVANGIALGDEGRSVFVRIYQSVLPWDPKYLQNICVVVTAVVTIGLAWSLSLSSTRREVRSGAPGS